MASLLPAVQPASGLWQCCGPAPLRPSCLPGEAEEVSLVPQAHRDIFNLNIHPGHWDGIQKGLSFLQRKDGLQGWVRDRCSAKIPVCICAHLAFSYDLLRSISPPAIFVKKDENKRSVHLKVTPAQCVSSRSWRHFWKMFYCPYCSCPETHTQHPLTAFQHMT